MAFERVVVLGHTGFIGSRVVDRLRSAHPDVEVLGFSLGKVDLGDVDGAAALADVLDPRTSVVMCAAIKRQLGDSPATYLSNTRIIAGFAELLTRRPVGRVVYLSSAAVYGEDIHNLSITEASPLNARSYYGLSKIDAEWILGRLREQGAIGSLTCVRPPTLYGPGDLPTVYGPSGFLDAAVNGREITLWGDGSELRELVYIDDVAPIVADLAVMSHDGPLNLAAGISYSFQDALAAVRRVVGRDLAITSRPRSKDQVDNRFDPAALKALFPHAAFTPLEEGVRLTAAARYGAVA